LRGRRAALRCAAPRRAAILLSIAQSRLSRAPVAARERQQKPFDFLLAIMGESTIVLRPSTSRGSRLTPQLVCAGALPTTFNRDDSSDDSNTSSSANRRGVWALLDQGIVSLGNCATSVLIARELPVAQFGMFAILLEAMQFLNTLQAALVTYPLTVRGSVMRPDALRRLSGACLLLTALLSLPLGLAILFAAGVVGSFATGLLTVVAMVLWQFQETLRRGMMAQGGHKRTVPGDAVSYLGQAACIAILAYTGTLTVQRAFAVMGLTSAAALLVQCIQIRPSFDAWRDLRGAAADFWKLGRWVMFGNFTNIVTTLGCSWTLLYFHGTDAVGKFQALANLMKLSNPLTICMAGLVIPAAARAFCTHGVAEAKRVTLRYALMAAAALLPYYALLLLLPTTFIHLLYGDGSVYGALGNQLRAYVIWWTALLVAQIAGCFLNAIEQSRRSFVAQAVQTACVVLVALPLTALYGLDGLMLGGVIGNLVMAACYVAMTRRIDDRDEDMHLRMIRNEMVASSRMAA
jgi:O-antigen/teichoic acid export membrane protein